MIVVVGGQVLHIRLPGRDRGEHDDARLGGSYRVALSGSFWPISACRSGQQSARSGCLKLGK